VKVDRSIIGLDLSLRGPAACLIPAGWTVGVWDELVYRSWVTTELEAPTPAERYERLIAISGAVCSFVVKCQPTAVYVEDYAFHAPRVVALAELGGVVRVDLFREGYIAIPAPQATVRKRFLGKMPRSGAKEIIKNLLKENGAPFKNDDECDAFVVANYGRSESGMVAMTLGAT
jgi:Holliday junction resolvasome RuvABC endonuclease subunit